AKPSNARCKKAYATGEVEIYDSLRYFTVTGCHLEGTPTTIESRLAELAEVYLKVFGPWEQEQQASQSSATPVDLTDEQLLAKAMASKHGERFRAAWEGNVSLFGNDDSRADWYLCRRLAFWTNRDRQRMDRLFRQSKLMRDKWDAKRKDTTYGWW